MMTLSIARLEEFHYFAIMACNVFVMYLYMYVPPKSFIERSKCLANKALELGQPSEYYHH